jgi:hypothetical protein
VLQCGLHWQHVFCVGIVGTVSVDA